jgi:hypothetical protein
MPESDEEAVEKDLGLPLFIARDVVADILLELGKRLYNCRHIPPKHFSLRKAL